MFVVGFFFPESSWLVSSCLIFECDIKIKLKLDREFFQGNMPVWLSKSYIYQEPSTSAKIERWWETEAM